jgi:hypothetical protein
MRGKGDGMSELRVIATDTAGNTYLFDKPTPFNASNDPFLFGLEMGKKEGRKEALDAVFQINGPSSAITQLRAKYGID